MIDYLMRRCISDDRAFISKRRTAPTTLQMKLVDHFAMEVDAGYHVCGSYSGGYYDGAYYGDGGFCDANWTGPCEDATEEDYQYALEKQFPSMIETLPYESDPFPRIINASYENATLVPHSYEQDYYRFPFSKKEEFEAMDIEKLTDIYARVDKEYVKEVEINHHFKLGKQYV
ncbi:MAG: hypothetical protein V5B36_00990 [Candidatus Accumulibacter sp. UW25]